MLESKIKLIIQQFPFIIDLFHANLDVFVVGGFVRDHFLDKKSKDIDLLVTGISVEDLSEYLILNGHQVDLVGQSFGVLKLKGFDIDIAVPRREKKIGSSHTSFAIDIENVSLEEDLLRRDFTINSIALNLKTGVIVDPFNGLKDIESKLIRMTNHTAFSEDGLRLLRAVQFSSRFNFQIEESTMLAIQENTHLINDISVERIIIEFDKIFEKGDHVLGAMQLVETGLFDEISQFTESPSFELLSEVKLKSDFFFALFHQEKESFFENFLKLDNLTVRRIKSTIKLCMSHSEDILTKRLIIFDIIKEDIGFLKTGLNFCKDELDEFRSNKFPLKITDLALSGQDLLNMGFKGKEIGNAQKLFLKAVLKGVTNNKDSLLYLLNLAK